MTAARCVLTVLTPAKNSNKIQLQTETIHLYKFDSSPQKYPLLNSTNKAFRTFLDILTAFKSWINLPPSTPSKKISAFKSFGQFSRNYDASKHCNNRKSIAFTIFQLSKYFSSYNCLLLHHPSYYIHTPFLRFKARKS